MNNADFGRLYRLNLESVKAMQEWLPEPKPFSFTLFALKRRLSGHAEAGPGRFNLQYVSDNSAAKSNMPKADKKFR